MNGPEHYTEAERLLAEAAETRESGLPRWTPEGIAAIGVRALAHATLAQTAATVDAGNSMDGEVAHSVEWSVAVG